MNKLYNQVKLFARKHTKHDSAISHFISFLYQVFSNELADAIISIIGTVIIGIMTSINYYGLGFYLVIFVYILCVLLMALAKRHQNEKLHNLHMLKQALIGGTYILREWAIELQKSAKTICSLKRRSPEAMKNAVASINFQSAAFVVCENLCDTLCKYCDNDNIYITVYQKYSDSNVTKCKMIAYSGKYEPSTFNETYIIPDDSTGLLGEIEYHTYLFSTNKTDMVTLPDKESIRKCFVLHQKSSEREEVLQQYIAIPIAPAKLGVTFLLQVDTNISELFGKDSESVKNFAKTAIYPFAQFLHMVYEQSRTVEQLIGGEH